ncbi:hypothetical protein D9756_003977 [Leucocoprinus leucothites]|uniref:Micro-fibrillar-associated protein 1 C-terminal domain-containing protein n=1 Tax=Leucocoprinus leucothites TaxID=201217 RepID=A0A8H5FZQ1_9AGAR|nr:hypothetical protein D9756_003977 [Leucoagaricus leucothites]
MDVLSISNFRVLYVPFVFLCIIGVLFCSLLAVLYKCHHSRQSSWAILCDTSWNERTDQRFRTEASVVPCLHTQHHHIRDLPFLPTHTSFLDLYLMATVPRKQAPRLPRPAARYWKGKAPKGIAEVESDSDIDEDTQEFEFQEDGDVQIRDVADIEMSGSGEEEEGMQIPKTRVDIKGKNISVALKDVSVSKEGTVIVAGRLESGKTEMEGEEESSEEESSEEEKRTVGEEESEEESGEDESESEEEAPKPLFRPVFVPKRARATMAEKDALAEDSEEMQRKREQEAEERRKQSHDMVAESIRRELAEKEKEDEVPDVDDTDGLDPEGEFEAWRLRELARIKREKEEELQREQEREEIERRRALPEEQRLKEDLERAEKSRAEKPKGQQKFLQKYWHKGAFHQDEEVLKRRDYTEATESTIDVSLLPKVMQVKNFGKRGRTKYTHLLDQDTTAGNGGFGGSAPVKMGGTGTEAGGCFLCGGPHLKKERERIFLQRAHDHGKTIEVLMKTELAKIIATSKMRIGIGTTAINGEMVTGFVTGVIRETTETRGGTRMIGMVATETAEAIAPRGPGQDHLRSETDITQEREGRENAL